MAKKPRQGTDNASNAEPSAPPEYLPSITSMALVGRDPEGRTLPHDFDRNVAELVAKMRAAGRQEQEISRLLNIRVGVLRRHYRYELDNGAVYHETAVAICLLDQASKPGNVRATELYLKARAGWRETDDKQSGVSPLHIHIHT
jgi:hypothetical protein